MKLRSSLCSLRTRTELCLWIPSKSWCSPSQGTSGNELLFLVTCFIIHNIFSSQKIMTMHYLSSCFPSHPWSWWLMLHVAQMHSWCSTTIDYCTTMIGGKYHGSSPHSTRTHRLVTGLATVHSLFMHLPIITVILEHFAKHKRALHRALQMGNYGKLLKTVLKRNFQRNFWIRNFVYVEHRNSCICWICCGCARPGHIRSFDPLT